MNRSESKYRNTAKRFDEALIRLMQKKKFSDITILDLCKEAEITRSAFYAHYNNISDVLEELKNSLTEEFFEIYKVRLNEEDIERSRPEDLLLTAPKYVEPYLEFVLQHKSFFKIYLNNNSNAFSMEERNNFIFDRILIPIFRKLEIKDTKKIQYLTMYFMTGLISIITMWVNNDCQEEISFILDIIATCVRPNMQILKSIQ